VEGKKFRNSKYQVRAKGFWPKTKRNMQGVSPERNLTEILKKLSDQKLVLGENR